MEDLIIKKSDVENLGRKLMKEVYVFFNRNYDYVIPCEDIKIEKDKFLKYLTNFIYFDKNENFFKKVEIKIEDESLNIDLIFEILDKIKVDIELDEDLHFKKKAFLNIYSVFDSDYKYLYN